jgi:hypothetical protein
MKKKILAVLLAAVLLLLNGCAASDAVSGYISSHSLRKIKGFAETSKAVFDAEFAGKTLVLVTVDVFENGSSCYTLCTVNTASAKVTGFQSLENLEIKNPREIEIDDDGNILYIGYHEIPEDRESDDGEAVEESLYCQKFSLKNLQPVGKEFAYSVEEEEAENKILGETYIEKENYMYFMSESYRYGAVNAFAFRDDSDHIYLADCNDFCPFDDYGRKLAGTITQFDSDGNPADKNVVAVYDFENNVLVNSVDISENSDYLNNIKLNDKYVFFATEKIEPGSDGEIGDVTYYLWSYNLQKKNEPFTVNRKSADDIDNDITVLSTAIKDSYGIDIHINEQNPVYEEGEDYSLVLGVKPYNVYRFLDALLFFLDKMPDGFVREIYCDLPQHEYGGFDIYVADGVVGTASAYTQSYTDNMTICFGMGGMDIGTIAHEFMHAIDVRIDDRLEDTEGVAFFQKWEKLNPEGFEYNGFDNENGIEYDDNTDDYFVSPYAMSTDAEDRAELFSSLYVDALNGRTPYWYDENEPLRKKTAFLQRSIREAFPSMQNVDVAPWETETGRPE